MSLLVLDGVLQATATVDFAGVTWVVLAATVVAALLADRALARVRIAQHREPARVPVTTR